MSKPFDPSATPAGDDRNLVTVDESYIAPTLEDKLRMFWSRHSRTIILACVLVVAVILGRGAIAFFAEQKEKGIQEAYALAKTTDQKRAFISANPSHQLAGIAQLQLADEAYAAGKYTDASAGYQQAADVLGNTLFGMRAKLGAAVSKLLDGQADAGKAALQAIVTDLEQPKSIRAEAAYHLATIVKAEGNTQQTTDLIDQILSLDQGGLWARRAFMLRATIPAAPADGAAPSVSGTPAAPAGDLPQLTFPSTKS